MLPLQTNRFAGDALGRVAATSSSSTRAELHARPQRGRAGSSRQYAPQCATMRLKLALRVEIGEQDRHAVRLQLEIMAQPAGSTPDGDGVYGSAPLPNTSANGASAPRWISCTNSSSDKTGELGQRPQGQVLPLVGPECVGIFGGHASRVKVPAAVNDEAGAASSPKRPRSRFG